MRRFLLIRRGPNLVVLFSVAVALILAGGAFVVGRELTDSIAREARTGAENIADAFTRLSLEEEEYSDGRITEEGREDLTEHLRRVKAIVGVTLWNTDRRVAVTLGRTEPDERQPGSRSDAPLLVAALAGQIRSELTHAARGQSTTEVRRHGHRDETVSVYVPVRLEPDARPSGVLEIYVPYAPVQAQITSRTNRLYLIIGIATVLVYLALLPMMWRASRALERANAARHIALQRAVRRAMARDEFELHYQPKIALDNESVDNVEALLRWRHPKRGLVPPMAYLPQIEGTPLIGPLSLHVFALACRQAADWRRERLNLNIAVNLSAANLEDPDLPALLGELLDEFSLEASDFTLEVTETAVMQATEQAEAILLRLRHMGFILSVDDFGSGYSSLARLDQLPADELKIDRSFIRALEQDGNTKVIASVIALAHELDLTCVAEGIELPQTAHTLAALGCRTGQGFHWSPALPADELRDWLRDRAPMAAAPAA
jgi:EAL domain-containing protein (putative c-di-GMP-specific phosphodiesterase class I)